MKAAVLYELNQPVVVEDIEMEGPKKGEVLVKVAATGVCHSCYHAVTGKISYPLPVVLGDEGAGVVEEVGEGCHFGEAGRPRNSVVGALLWILHLLYARLFQPLPESEAERTWTPL